MSKSLIGPQIVEKNPAKFRIDASELSVRKGFIASTRDEVAQMKRRTEGKHASAAAAAGSSEEVCMELWTLTYIVCVSSSSFMGILYCMSNNHLKSQYHDLTT